METGGAHCPASLAEIISFRFSENTAFKKKNSNGEQQNIPHIGPATPNMGMHKLVHTLKKRESHLTTETWASLRAGKKTTLSLHQIP